tara:strand:+ start:472 stop:918 length:447 start_codon:yes stop_codon:yes gene_type:complete
MKLKYLEQPKEIPLAFLPGSRGERVWKLTEDVKVTLSDGYTLLIPKGFETDLRSAPKFLWALIQPFNNALFAYVIHDRLYADKLGQMKHFSLLTGKASPYEAKKFADEEMYKWATALAPKRKLENYLSYLAVRWFGNPVYWGRKSVPI